MIAKAKIYIKSILVLLLLSCLNDESLHIKVDPESLGISTKKLNNLISELNGLVDDGQVPGIQTALIKNGKLVSFHTYGFSDIESQKKLAENSIFRIYSMTKPVVSVGLMMLYERGLFQLDEDISRYIPQFKDLMVYDSVNNIKSKSQIKIIDLLRHSSGIGYGWSDNQKLNSMYSQIWQSKNNAEFVDKVSEIPLFTNPNTEWRYGVNTDICGYLIEVLTGQTLDQYLSESIFEPLGMKDTHFKLPDVKINRFTSNYMYNKNSKKLNRVDKFDSGSYSNVTWFGGGGGLVSTTKDYIKFTLTLLKNKNYSKVRLIKDETIDLMTENHIAHLSYPWGDGIGFGLGFSVVTDEKESELKDDNGTFGWSGMAGTIFSINPKEELILVFMTQRNHPWGNIHKIFNNFAYDSIIR